MSFATNSPSALLADKEWRRKNSRWRWWVFLGFGLLGCVGFLIVAFRVQSKKFWTAATVASVGSAAAWLAMSLSGETSGTTTSSKTPDTASDGGWGSGVTMAIWVAQIVYAILLNREYLRWKADNRNEWYNQTAGGPIASNVVPAPPTTQPTSAQGPPFLGVDTSAYFANAPAPQPQPPAPATVAATPQRSTHGTIDINSASAGEIAMAVGVEDEVIRRVVDARISVGGFRNIDDLVTRARLQPHEMMRGP